MPKLNRNKHYLLFIIIYGIITEKKERIRTSAKDYDDNNHSIDLFQN
jgi:hypothetical protein